MEIVWYGLSCFRLKDRHHATIVTDPYHGKVGLPQLKLKGDVVTISHDATGHNNSSAVSGRRRELSGPGEYEIGNVFITGIATVGEANKNGNILYLFDYGGLTIAHLGDMFEVPSQTQIEALEQVDILLVPAGGGSSLNAAKAAELVSMLEPGVVIPMHYKIPGLKLDLEGVDRFLKEMGVNDPLEEDSLKLSKSNVTEETQVVLLSPRIK